MKKPELIAAIAEETGLTKDKSGEVLNALLDEITNAMTRDDAVSLIGFGTFSQRTRSARTGKNPQTGKAIQIPASKSVGFKPGKALKDAVN
ncbi:DNA-binding protein HU [Oleiphilus sp. HI0071]|jgi:DNA-binding protein HU-alpha|uniref:HU family DNA-binding protein n=1 Tax=unclassified Oleiphilus TaxID=2631174 RepID=UPI0007C3FF7E|nr:MULTISPECIES: HU family DNA-binding protein [unclassified Oleiphilus]KZY61428.1 DNA-binding protein HU [Oleiphilus sp. HI0065]KZY82168.1 DNA-binding protein HU [Oleiphilus sp. HI0071]KZY97334.1 DNA-binding protein HU [Oleiphilus sp. HI0073]KZZ52094.1 DNA-binding protein HU [Oleiphilus sp. HI0122]KZZ54658.1 DNA-binding protein HU [Oleiphilus sp. HI0118]KZZ74472.1 DNA-binding protein HU [Oleiphilus sp. HI0130]KZZ77408.1 DNA-binding protein HU [Oleiphilus sp. HI0133]